MGHVWAQESIADMAENKEEIFMKEKNSTQQSLGKKKALIVISSAKILPLAEPSGHPGISTGFFLVEMAKILQSFGDEYEFVFATPDGQLPQLDINGMALSFHAGAGLGPAMGTSAMAQAACF